MITGFNTDVEYDGVTYHVQTEDKGLRTPFILSLVYNRGTILASKRVPYDDLIANGFDEQELARRLQKIHKTICAAISKGRLEDLKRVSGRAPVPVGAMQSAVAGLSSAAVDGSTVGISAQRADRVASDRVEVPLDVENPIPMPPDPEAIPRAGRNEPHTDKSADRSFAGAPLIAEEAIVGIVSELAGTDRPVGSKLSIELVGDSTFRAGEKKTVTVLVSRGGGHKVVPDAEVMIKVLGSSFRPLINHSRTNHFGISSFDLNLPHFNEGRAAVIVRVINKGEEVELRRPLLQSR